jgi:voltage-gated potassium channel Kch
VPIGVRLAPRRVRHRVQKQIDRWTERVTENPFKGAWRVIAVVTIGVTALGGVLVRLSDPSSIQSLASGFWWSLQTVTTVGYGDVVPASSFGRFTAAIVMLVGLSFLSVTTAAVTNAFVEASARRRGARSDIVLDEVRQLRAELEQLRAELTASSHPGDEAGPAIPDNRG